MRRGRVCAAALAFALAALSRASACAATDLAFPVPLDAPTQRACAPADADARLFTISISPFRLTSFGDYPPEYDEVYYLPDTPYFHALWVDGLAAEFAARDLEPSAGPLARACIHPATREAGDVYRSEGVSSGTYIVVVLVRSKADVASVDGGFIHVAPHSPGRTMPSARFFEAELDLEPGVPVKQFGHFALVDEVP